MLDALVRGLALPVDAKAKIVRPRKQQDRYPSVSVVIPCYNYGRYLSQCVNSVLEQQGVRVNVLIIDDKSSDGSDQIARQLGEQDLRIRTLCHTTNQGHIATYNEGIMQATGDYVVLLSADDLLTPGCLARATSLMEQYPSVGLTYGFPVEFTDGHLPAARTTAKSWIIWEGRDWISQRCKTGGNALKAPEAILRTSVLHEIGGGYRSHLPHAADFELWMRAATISDVGYIAGADQAYYRNHTYNMHQGYNYIDDFSQRLIAFDTVFNERSDFMKDADSLRETAHRTLARIALSQAMRDTLYRALAGTSFSHTVRTYSCAAVGDESVADYAAFALKVWPNARNLREWRTVDKLLNARGNPSGLNPSLITRMAIRKLRTRSREWRRRWVGM